VTARERPDVALVGLGLSSDHALDVIAEIVHESACPVIALLSARDPTYIREAAKRGVFAYIVDADAEELQSAIDITLQRFAEYHNLQGAFGRRALIEQAKGILMARHGIDERRAFELLKSHSQRNGRKVVDVATRSSRAISCCCRRYSRRPTATRASPDRRNPRRPRSSVAWRAR
jgi:AmiR/NasT family two-component response regulator